MRPASGCAAIKSSDTVIQQLLEEMNELVQSYHPDVRHTGRTVSDLIAGTAMFPGGTGLWRGDGYFGPIPESFPDRPVMFVGHNFDSITAFERSRTRGGEVQSPFWKVLKGFINAADLIPEQCFFTNVLMGVKSGSALGAMPTVAGYKEQCLRFFRRQVEITNPRAIVTLGRNARDLVSRMNLCLPLVHAMHPSAREFNPLATREDRVRAQGLQIRRLLNS